GRHRQRRQRAHDDDHLHDGLQGFRLLTAGGGMGAVPVRKIEPGPPSRVAGGGAVSPATRRGQRPGGTTTTPSFITKETLSVAVMSCRGSSFIPTRSASAPGATVPSSDSFPSIVAATTVPERSACQGLIPQAT